MRALVLALVLPFALPAAAQADACRDEIAALFDGGALDPFARPNRREVSVAVHPDGSISPVSDVIWDGVTRSVNCTPAGCAMAIGNRAWSGPGPEGPWTYAGESLSGDIEALTRKVGADMAANLAGAACPGEAIIEGRNLRLYRYRTQTNPNAWGSWWGGLYTAFVDIDSGRLLRLEQAEGVASWAPKPSADVQVTTVTYDETIHIEEP